MQKENLWEGVMTGVFLSLAIGIIAVWVTKPSFSSIIFILSLALLPGFFIMTLVYIYKIGKEKILKSSSLKEFDWGVEVNLRRLQIMHTRQSSMMQTAGLIATGAFLSMAFLAKDFPQWQTGHQIFFPIATTIFIAAIHLAFRWWFSMRQDINYLRFQKDRA